MGIPHVEEQVEAEEAAEKGQSKRQESKTRGLLETKGGTE